METDRLRGREIVVLDTNMLLVPYQFGVDILEEIQRLLPGARIVTVKPVLKELEKIERQGLHGRLGVRIARKILERVEILDTPEKPVDTLLVELAEKGYIIATNDKELKKRVWERGGSVIFLREESHLELL